MKISSAFAFVISIVASCDAFSVSSKSYKTMQDLTKVVTTMATTFTIAASVATASPTIIDSGSAMNDSLMVKSSIVVSSVDPFAMPKYEEASQNKSLDMRLDLTNQAALEKAAAKRDDKNIDKENNQRFQELKRLEAEEDARLMRMKKYAEQERLEKIEREKAEIRANKWNTF